VAKQQALEAKAETETQRDEARVAAYASGMGLAHGGRTMSHGLWDDGTW
jgi:hypothetical protein